jgi:hypothetical protein
MPLHSPDFLAVPNVDQNALFAADKTIARNVRAAAFADISKTSHIVVPPYGRSTGASNISNTPVSVSFIYRAIVITLIYRSPCVRIRDKI